MFRPGYHLAGLLRNRPDVRAAEYRLAAAKEDVDNKAAQRFPKLTLTGTLGLLALAAGDLLSGDALTATIGTGVSGRSSISVALPPRSTGRMLWHAKPLPRIEQPIS